MEAEGLLACTDANLKVTALGKAFTKNIRMVFGRKLRKGRLAGKQVFSKVI